MNDDLAAQCEKLVSEYDLIPKERKEKLRSISKYIATKNAKGHVSNLVVICTHNSRRSHMGQLWLAAAADYYKVKNVQSFSGGTEETQFNSSAVEALYQVGFDIATKDKEFNPIYEVTWSRNMTPHFAFSKQYHKAPNPQKDFAAIMVCTEADAGCPVVSGCDFRIALPFDDPKAFDGTKQEKGKYLERAKQIGREMLYVLSQVKK